MKTGSLLLVVAALLVGGATNAAALPDWLLGDWVVTKVYQLNDGLIHYRNSEAEPVVKLTGKIMTIEANRLHLGVDICTDLTVQEKRDNIRHLVKDVKLGGEPEMYGGLTPRPGRLPYLDINCGKPFSEGPDGIGAREANSVDWVVIPNGHDKIDLMFLYPCYVELRRRGKPVS
ncbi:hypothetical protein [Telmatospirillum sp.]|uniref:hypothetical protein n=1 Tax=Telmatospirillum sp. TaxID=2079197 RepID=UPI00284BE572|nr:hypothetical protein [Telmatospirillum sp.]MDR3440952.1 hypothetical protein [Telmatospirillum sp.]